MSSIKGKKVLITGGANGIGKIMGELSLEKGASDLVIWDINETNLQQTADALMKQGYRVHPYQVDVSDLNDIKWAFETVFNEIGPIDILINNAGIVVGKDFNDHSFEDIKRTIDINVLAVMNVTKLCLDQMINQNMGHIVNIASAAGLMGNPKMSVYA